MLIMVIVTVVAMAVGTVPYLNSSKAIATSKLALRLRLTLTSVSTGQTSKYHVRPRNLYSSTYLLKQDSDNTRKINR